MTPRVLSGRAAITVLTAAAVVGIATTVAVHAAGERAGRASHPALGCAAPALPGHQLSARLTDMHGMGPHSGPMAPMPAGRESMPIGSGRVVLSQATVAAGTVSLVAVNAGHAVHELVVLPLDVGRTVGERPVSNDGTVEETGSLGEASASCAGGAGDGIEPGASGWVTLSLRPGRYEVLCNLPDHYAAGMYAELTVV